MRTKEMITIEQIILFWLLPTLVTYLGVFFYVRTKGGTLDGVDLGEWGDIHIVSVFYPIAIFLVIVFMLFLPLVDKYIPSLPKHFFTKERKLWEK